MEAALEGILLTVQMRKLIPRDVAKRFQSRTQKPKDHSLALSSMLSFRDARFWIKDINFNYFKSISHKKYVFYTCEFSKL